MSANLRLWPGLRIYSASSIVSCIRIRDSFQFSFLAFPHYLKMCPYNSMYLSLGISYNSRLECPPNRPRVLTRSSRAILFARSRLFLLEIRCALLRGLAW